jgi:hypothetical protein
MCFGCGNNFLLAVYISIFIVVVFSSFNTGLFFFSLVSFIGLPRRFEYLYPQVWMVTKETNPRMVWFEGGWPQLSGLPL